MQAKGVLRAGQVHHADGATARAHRAHHPQRHPAQAGLQRDGVTRLHAQLALRGGVERDAVGRKQVEAVDARHLGGQAGHQQRGQRAGHQGVEAEYAQGHGRGGRPSERLRCRRGVHRRGAAGPDTGRAIATQGRDPARLRLQLDHRVGNRHLGALRDGRVQRFIEQAACGPQAQVGLAIDRAHRRAELAQRRGVDQVHRKSQGHAQQHRQHRGAVAQAVVAQLLPGKGAQQSAHGGRQPGRAALRPHRATPRGSGAAPGRRGVRRPSSASPSRRRRRAPGSRPPARP